MHTMHCEPEVLAGHACGAPSRAGVVAAVCRQRLPDLQRSWKTAGRGEAAGGLAGMPCPRRGCAAPCCTSGQDTVAPSSAAQLSPVLAPRHGGWGHARGVAGEDCRGQPGDNHICEVISDGGGHWRKEGGR